MISPEEYRNIVQRLQEADEMEKELRQLKGLPEIEPKEKDNDFYSLTDEDY